MCYLVHTTKATTNSSVGLEEVTQSGEAISGGGGIGPRRIASDDRFTGFFGSTGYVIFGVESCVQGSGETLMRM